jgi:hypothetical protein
METGGKDKDREGEGDGERERSHVRAAAQREGVFSGTVGQHCPYWAS